MKLDTLKVTTYKNKKRKGRNILRKTVFIFLFLGLFSFLRLTKSPFHVPVYVLVCAPFNYMLLIYVVI
jgi:hypothetical protein